MILRKRILSVLVLFSLLMAEKSVNAQAGAGVGTKTPHPAAMLEVASTTKGLLPPRMTLAQQNAIANPAAGLMVWCIDCGSSGEMRVFNGLSWSNLIGFNDAKSLVFQNELATYVNDLDITETRLSFEKDSSRNGTLSVPYSGGNFIKYSSQVSTSTGILGLTASLQSGNLSSSGKVEVKISGIPSGLGTANFTFKFGSNNQTFSVNVQKIRYRVGDLWKDQNCNNCIVVKISEEKDNKQYGLLGVSHEIATFYSGQPLYQISEKTNGEATWQEATDNANNLVLGEITNWRLPTTNEVFVYRYYYYFGSWLRNNNGLWTSERGRTRGWYYILTNNSVLKLKDEVQPREKWRKNNYLPVSDFIHEY